VEVHPQSLYVSLMIALTLHLTAPVVLLSVLLIPALVTVPLLENAAMSDHHQPVLIQATVTRAPVATFEFVTSAAQVTVGLLSTSLFSGRSSYAAVNAVVTSRTSYGVQYIRQHHLILELHKKMQEERSGSKC
jgi:hypothetical protein